MSGSDDLSMRPSTVSAWIPIAVGLVALFIPTYVSLSKGIWQTEEQGHGPLILAVVAWLVWKKREVLATAEELPSPISGFFLVFFGVLCYVFGRSQDVLMLEVGSQIPILAGSLLITCGRRALREMWFPLFFLVFMVPLPSLVVDALTGPLKQYVSVIAEHLLYGVGYPIARSGVTLTIGPYQLLVADACSGLHSLYSLAALGLLYLYLMSYRNAWRNVFLGLTIVPIAVGANIVRVIVLVLVTYHLGDEAGQGFLHGFAGMVLFVAALMFLFLLDAIAGVVGQGFQRRSNA